MPLFVLSAGIKEVIDASFLMIDSEVHLKTQVKVISNEFLYKDGKTHARPPSDILINPTAKQHQLYKHAQRSNVVLLGDILQDAKMACD